MLTYGFLADGLLESQNNKENALNKYCKLEGMDCQQLISESRSIKNLFGKKKYPRTETNHSSRTN